VYSGGYTVILAEISNAQLHFATQYVRSAIAERIYWYAGVDFLTSVPKRFVLALLERNIGPMPNQAREGGEHPECHV
jgi:hypothetical protein